MKAVLYLAVCALASVPLLVHSAPVFDAFGKVGIAITDRAPHPECVLTSDFAVYGSHFSRSSDFLKGAIGSAATAFSGAPDLAQFGSVFDK